jgi:hypothetical protein
MTPPDLRVRASADQYVCGTAPSAVLLALASLGFGDGVVVASTLAIAAPGQTQTAANPPRAPPHTPTRLGEYATVARLGRLPTGLLRPETPTASRPNRYAVASGKS